MEPHAPVAQTEQTAPLTTPAGKSTSRTVVVYFDPSSDEIRASAMQVLYGAAQDLRGAQLAAIRIVGHTDASGRRGYNQKLSERRAATVADQLTKLGVRAPITEVTGSGEGNGKGPRSSKDNRRVEIVFDYTESTTAAVASTTTQAAALAAPVSALTEILVPAAAPAEPHSPAVTANDKAPTPLQRTDKTAIKQNLSLAGPAWLPPAAA